MTEQPGDGPEQTPDAPAKSTTKSATEGTAEGTSKDATKGKAKSTAKSTARSSAEARPSRPARTRRRPYTGSTGHALRRAGDALATAIVIVAAAVAIILAVHVVFVVFEANAANGIVKTINGWARTLAWNFKDIFTPTNPKTAALVNYGLAAVIYLIAGRALSVMIRRIG